MKILVTGARGMLGQDISELLTKKGYSPVTWDIEDLDLTDKEETDRKLFELRPDIIINCCAYTAVDKAQEEPEKCTFINETTAKNLAEYCGANNAMLIHFSTDYVFPGLGQEPYKEDDEVKPLNIYGRSKALSEDAVRKNAERHFILRISWLYSDHGKNFVDTMLKLSRDRNMISVVSDQTGSPTYGRDVAEMVMFLLDKKEYGTYHLTNEGYTTWYELAKEIIRYSGRAVEVRPLTSEEYKTLAVRPKNSRLSKEKFKRTFGIEMPAWQDALERCMKALTC